MANNYNVDDILDEIKRKKSTVAGQMVPVVAARSSEDQPRNRSRDYSDEEEYSPVSQRREAPETPRHRRDVEEDYAPISKRRTLDEDDYIPVQRKAKNRPEPDDYEDDVDYSPAPKRRPMAEEDDYIPKQTKRRAVEDDYEPQRSTKKRPEYEDEDYIPPQPKRRNYEDEEYEAPRQKRAAYRDDEEYASAPKRRTYDDEEPEPPRAAKGRAYKDKEDYQPPAKRVEYDDEEYAPSRSRGIKPERESRPSVVETEDDLSILRTRISRKEEPRRSKFADLEGEPAQPQQKKILTDRADILRNFGRHRENSGPADDFDSGFRSAKMKRAGFEEPDELTATRHRSEAEASTRKRSDEEAEALSATQMNLDIYAITDENDLGGDESGSHIDTKSVKGKRGKKKAVTRFTPESEMSSEADDFNTPKDANHVYGDISHIKKGIKIRVGATALFAAALIYFGLAIDNVALPLPFFMLPENDMRIFIAAHLGLLLLSVLMCSATIGGGIISMIKLKAGSDTPIAIAAIAAIAQGVVLTVFPEMVTATNVNFYFAVACLGLLFNNIGKLFMINRIERNFKLLADAGYQRHAFNIVGDRNLARELTRNQNLEEPVIGYSHPAGFLTNFLGLSYTEDYGENITKITAPLFFIFSLVASAITQIIYGDVFASLTAFTAMTAICAPLTTTITGNLPLGKMNKALVKEGSMVAGYTALDRFDDINCLVIKDSELFAHSAITLHGIKSFDQKRIDEAMIDAASVVCKSECVLSGIFTQMIGGNERILKKADSIVYEDSMGISAWVDGKRVLIGNRSLMENHSIEIPSKDYERKFVRDGREVLYLSNSGDLTAMFVLSYNADPDISDQLRALEERGIGIAIYTTDSNITPQKIEEVFEFPEDMVEIVPYKLHGHCDKLLEEKERAKAEIVYNGSLASKVRILSALVGAKTSIVLGTVLQSIGMIAGYGLIAFFAFTNSIGSVTFELLLAYQCFWALVVMLLPNLRRY